MFYELPPAGGEITLQRNNPQIGSIDEFFRPLHVRLFGTGTSALAAAVVAAVRRRERRRPEVILPAYACPDVVSAVLCAGARPVLVDLEPQRPWMDLGRVRERITANTIAIIAVNFLGIPERVRALRDLAGEAGLVLIEDSAQAFPVSAEESAALAGDFVVLSFGRGKPISLLGGGALLWRDAGLAERLPMWDNVFDRHIKAEWGFRVRAAAYNLLRRPRLYWTLRAFPFLGLGETTFQYLSAVEPEPVWLKPFLGANIERYRNFAPPAAGWIRERLRGLEKQGVMDLAQCCGLGPLSRLLRFPVLITREGKRGRVLRALRAAGLGASALYEKPLAAITGVKEATGIEQEYPRARTFADELLTLPTHAQVTRADVEKIGAIMQRELGVE